MNDSKSIDDFGAPFLDPLEAFGNGTLQFAFHGVKFVFGHSPLPLRLWTFPPFLHRFLCLHHSLLPRSPFFYRLHTPHEAGAPTTRRCRRAPSPRLHCPPGVSLWILICFHDLMRWLWEEIGNWDFVRPFIWVSESKSLPHFPFLVLNNKQLGILSFFFFFLYQFFFLFFFLFL